MIGICLHQATPRRCSSLLRPRRARVAPTTAGGWPRQPCARCVQEEKEKSKLQPEQSKKRKDRRRPHLVAEDVVGRPSSASSCTGGRDNSARSAALRRWFSKNRKPDEEPFQEPKASRRLKHRPEIKKKKEAASPGHGGRGETPFLSAPIPGGLLLLWPRRRPRAHQSIPAAFLAKQATDHRTRSWRSRLRVLGKTGDGRVLDEAGDGSSLDGEGLGRWGGAPASGAAFYREP